MWLWVILQGLRKPSARRVKASYEGSVFDVFYFIFFSHTDVCRVVMPGRAEPAEPGRVWSLGAGAIGSLKPPDMDDRN